MLDRLEHTPTPSPFPGSSSSRGGDPDAASTLWDINDEKQEDRIRARRKRISNRIEAAKKLTALLR